jgi:ATP-dependent Clp protease ATP-binding subunit ClpB
MTMKFDKITQRSTTPEPDAPYQALEEYDSNLTDIARKSKLDPIIGREEEIRRAMKILSRRTKNNPIIVDEPGVDKMTIAEELAQCIVNGNESEGLKKETVWQGNRI